MSVLGRTLFASSERLDLPDLLSIESFAAGDLKYLLNGLVGSSKPYILKGFDVINPEDSIGSQSMSIRVADSVVFYPGSNAGPFFHGLEEGNANAQPLVPELRKNATNFVYLSLSTFGTTKDTRAFWDPDLDGGEGGEFTQDVNTESALKVDINVSVSTFPENVIPVCKVKVGPNVIEEVQDCRDMLFRLAGGGVTPDPFSEYSFRSEPSAAYQRNEPPTNMTSSLDPNPFEGGDKNIYTLKEWMDVVMTKLKEIGGTTYWYEDVSTFGLINLFNDALGSTFKSKGQWKYDATTPGLITWTEDIKLKNIRDPREVIIRAGSKTLTDDQVAYVELKRDEKINTGNQSVNWVNGSNTVNGVVGSFASLSKGDYIKKLGDNNSRYLRVEEFYADSNLSGGITSPALAKSIKLSANYAGSTETQQGVYSKGVYSSLEVSLAARGDTSIEDIGGNLSWMALRSDVIMNVSDITSFTLTIDFREADGKTVKCISSGAHGLEDGDRITVDSGSTYAGTYKIEVESSTVFYINTATTGDETGTSAYYARVTTGVRNTADGLELESANHNFEDDQKIIIAGTTNYNGSFEIKSRTATTFNIPVASGLANETAGTATLTRVNVRSEFGLVKVVQGETVNIGEADTESIQDFIGMSSLSDTSPSYSVPGSFNTLHGQQNYFSDLSDNLTARASKLTSMMADKAQDKTINFSGDWKIAKNTTNGAAQELTFENDSAPLLTMTLPGSQNNNSIGMGGTLSLLANQAAYFTIDRNAFASVADLSGLTVAPINQVPIDENVFIFAVRLAPTSVWLWDGTELCIGPNYSICAISDMIDDNAYDEELCVVAAAAANDNEVQGPVARTTTLTLPNDSRDNDNAQGYIVGQGVLEVRLNGQWLQHGRDWEEIGTPGQTSTTFRLLLEDLIVGDKLNLRIDTFGGYFGVGGGGGGNVTGGANVGTGQGLVFRDVSGGIMNFRRLLAGTGISIATAGDDIVISATGATPAAPYWVEYVSGVASTTITSAQAYNIGSNKLSVYRNGILMFLGNVLGAPIDRYEELSSTSIDLEVASVASEVISMVNDDTAPSWQQISGVTGTSLTVPTYVLGNKTLRLYRNGVLMNTASIGNILQQYSETSTTTVTLAQAAIPTDVFTVYIQGAVPTFREDANGFTGTTITIPGANSYTIGSKELLVYRNGVLILNTATLGAPIDRYTEASTTTIELGSAITASETLTFIHK